MTAAHPVPPQALEPGPAATPGKHLTFAIGGEEYGVPVLRVREIIRMLEVTPVPNAAAHCRGVVNLRGKVVPVVDLRIRLGYAPQPPDARTCIVVTDAALASGAVMVGLIVDAVIDVLMVTPDDMSPTPAIAGLEQMGCVRGLTRARGRMTLLLDVDRVIEAG